ncbi:MAG TPA: methyltransferase domain-containing protein [Solirubrobacteraceae bacterium]|nr:methyltransferase domain-containing protein [Solirubrobacteraceae bacterium]
MGTRVSVPSVIWHDLECGAYRADLALWRELAASRGGRPLLEIGAGTGRVALDLARDGHPVIAVERDDELAAELRRRSAGLPIEVIDADACDFELDAPVLLCIVAMQTVQLLEDRAAFLRCAHAALAPGGLLALALLGRDVQPFELELAADVVEHGGVRYASAPTALRETAGRVLLERRRTAFDGSSDSVSLDVTALARLEPATLAAEGIAAGFAYRDVLGIPPTAQHAGSQVVLLEARPR